MLKEELRYALLPLIKPESRVLTMSEACAVLHTSRTSMQRLIAAGEIKGFRMPDPDTGSWRFTEHEIARYLDRKMGREA